MLHMMKIRRRTGSVFEDVALSLGLLVVAVRTGLPIGGPGAYGSVPVRIVFGLLIAVPAACLLLANTKRHRRRALFLVSVTYGYVGILVAAVDWTRFGSASAFFVLATIAARLHYNAAREIKWNSTPSSSRSSRPSEGPQSSS